VTASRDAQTASTDILSYQDRTEVGGMIGPAHLLDRPGIFSGEGVRNLEHLKTILTRYNRYYTKTLKMYMTGTSPAASSGSSRPPRS
jgi:hypothetical protein